jgi:hypothetical protein
VETPREYEHVFSLLDPEGARFDGQEFHFRCPAHDDRHPSMTLRVGDKGLLVKCHAGGGCSFEEITAALAARARRPIHLLPWNGEGERDCRPPDWRPEGHWDYVDEANHRVLFRVLKFRDPATGRKKFSQMASDPEAPGGWRKGGGCMDGVRRVLYRLPELLANKALPPEKRRTVCLVEGEKDADSLHAVGVLATTASGGAVKFHLTDASPLAGQKVAVIPDVDPVDPKTGRRAGWDHLMQVCHALHGKAAELRVVLLPAGEGGDVSDWLASLGELPAAQKKGLLWGLIQRAPVFDPLAAGAPLPPFLRLLGREVDRLRKANPTRFRRPGELVGELEVELLALKNHLAGCRNAGSKPDPGELLDRAVRLAAQAMRAAEDCRWDAPEGISENSETPP